MSSRRLCSAEVLASTGLIAIVLAILAVPASAARHPSLGAFGPVAQPGFTAAKGLAVDQDTGDLLAIDAGAGTVRRFHADGTASNFSALGSNSIDGKSGPDQTPQGGLTFGSANEIQVAVDRSGTATDGNIYVTQGSAGALVDIFADDGSYLGQITGFGASTFASPEEPCGVAVDSTGAFYVGVYGGEIHKYEAAANPPVNADNTANFGEGITGVSNPCNLAAGSGSTAGALFVTGYSSGNVTKLSSSTGEFQYVISEGGNVTAAVDPATGHVYTGQGASVREFDAAEAFGPPILISSISGDAPIQGLAISGTTGEVYVSRTGMSNVEVYGPLAPPTPLIESQQVVNATATEAALKAEINPEGFATTYIVEYGPTASYGSSTSAQIVGSDEATHTVFANLNGLAPDTTYHFRFVATNEIGTSEGPDQMFKAVSPPEPESCPNQMFRAGPSSRLPDCRAYEMVSPVDKNGSGIKAATQGFNYRVQYDQSSLDGNRMTYTSYRAFADASGAPYGVQYVASRGGSGWATASLSPRKGGPEKGNAPYDLETEFKAFTDDLSRAWLENQTVPVLAPGAAPGIVNIYERDNLTNAYTALTQGVPQTIPQVQEIRFEGYSADGQHALFSANTGLIPGAAGGEKRQLYDFTEGKLKLVSVLPGGAANENTSTAGSSTAASNWPRIGALSIDHAISADGSKIFWTSSPSTEASPGDLYVRLNGSETIQIASGEAFFRKATPDGARALYEVGPEGSPNDLFVYDVNADTQSLIAGEVIGVLGASEDLEDIYLVSKEALATGSASGALNLFAYHSGTFTFIAPLSELDVNSGVAGPSDTSRYPSRRSSRVTPDGSTVAFMSTNPLKPGYDNTDRSSGEPAAEVYVYSADTNVLTCASCNPTGARPEAQRMRYPYTAVEEIVFSPGEWAAAWLTTSESSFHSPRALSSDGNRLIFNSYDGLVPLDTNGQQDVYQWEAQGAGSCHTAGGCIALISSGTSPYKSEFIDADPDGRNIFFETLSSLVPADPGLNDIYNARIEGGFPEPVQPAPGCEGEACQGASPPAPSVNPGSVSFSGAGNVRHANKGKRKQQKRGKKNKGRKSQSNKARGARSGDARSARRAAK